MLLGVLPPFGHDLSFLSFMLLSLVEQLLGPVRQVDLQALDLLAAALTLFGEDLHDLAHLLLHGLKQVDWLRRAEGRVLVALLGPVGGVVLQQLGFEIPPHLCREVPQELVLVVVRADRLPLRAGRRALAPAPGRLVVLVVFVEDRGHAGHVRRGAATVAAAVALLPSLTEVDGGVVGVGLVGAVQAHSFVE